MLVRLITTIVCLVLLAFFAGFNLDNKCDVNLLFKTFENVPVFVSIIIAFVTGVVFTLPFVFIHRNKSEKKMKSQNEKTSKKGFSFFKKSETKSDSEKKSSESEKKSVPDTKNAGENTLSKAEKALEVEEKSDKDEKNEPSEGNN